MTEPSPKDLKPQSTAVVIAFALILFAISAAFASLSVSVYQLGQQFSVLEYAGISIIVLGGCFDPVNFFWLCLPFTSKQVAVPTRFEALQWLVSGVGFVAFAVGWICKHWWP